MALFAACALAFQGLASAGVPMAMAVDSGTIRIVSVCTGDGYRQIVLDAGNKPIAPREQPDCFVCCLAFCAGLALPAEDCSGAEPVPQGLVPAFAISPFAERRHVRAWNSRAPPSVTRQFEI